MTDAREIIANTHVDDGDPIGLTHANAIVVMLHAAGFRILGPDEVDPVTLEKAAEAAYEAITDGEHAEEVGAAVRALGRKA